MTKISPRIWVFIGVVVFGMFLRTYHFHDLLRFNADQSRDAAVVSSYLSGESAWPLLGPKAGGTNFRLGGMFYHFQIIAATIFGDYPDVMAYPDLLFSLLAVVLMYFFLKKYFSPNIATLLTMLFAVSSYAIKYSRFAWNPNSTPFWSMLLLYSLHELLKEKNKNRLLWSVVAGVALGVGVQLHTLLLIMLPVVTGVAFVYLIVKKQKVWKFSFIVLGIGLLLNVSQITSEVKTGGENTKAFFGGVDTKEKKGSGILLNFAKDANCSVQSNTYILTGYNMSDQCELKADKKGINPAVTLFGVIFFIGGLILSFRMWKTEKNIEKKLFLTLVFGYFLLSFAILIPLANEISMRFYLIMIFLPFVLLGMWIQYLQSRFKVGNTAAIAVLLLLAGLNIFYVVQALQPKTSKGNIETVDLEEVERLTSFVVNHAENKQAYIAGDAQYLFKAGKSIQYLAEKSGVAVSQVSKKTPEKRPLFVIDTTKQKEKTLNSNNAIADHETIGRVTIYYLP